MGKRREPRQPVQVTVRILGTDAGGRPFAEKVETLDVSRSGVHLCGLTVALSSRTRSPSATRTRKLVTS